MKYVFIFLFSLCNAYSSEYQFCEVTAPPSERRKIDLPYSAFFDVAGYDSASHSKASRWLGSVEPHLKNKIYTVDLRTLTTL